MNALIISKEFISSNIVKLVLSAPSIAEKAKPGQFVIVVPTEYSERIPLTIGDSDTAKGTITIVAQIAGATTKVLSNLKEGEVVSHILGPLGVPSHIENFGEVAIIAGGVGVPEIYPIAKALKEKGNNVTTIIGARNKDLLIFEEELRLASSTLKVTTDDGSYGRKGFVSDELADLMKEKKIDRVIAVGPIPMMKKIADVTREAKIPTFVSLNALMLDATGMCGICRVTVGGKTKFTCVEGPDFDGHLVDFDELSSRLRYYKDKEKEALDHVCRIFGE